MKLKAVCTVVLCGIGTLTGCDRGSTRTITATRQARLASQEVKLDATSQDRFAMGEHMGDHMGGGGPQQPQGERKKPLAWDMPAGWSDRPDPQGMRLASFTVAGVPDADCSVVLLPGQAGGVDANVNRWRTQMGASELSPQEIEKLPTRPLLGGPAAIVEIAGSYKGMGDAPKAGFKLVGAIRQFAVGDQVVMIFVKMVGPAAVIDAERKNFEALCDSIRPARAGAPDDGKAQEPEPPAETPPLAWTAPAEWKKLPEKPMRTVSFLAEPQTECYVSVLPGPAGGLAKNLNRWRNQMGQPPLDDAGLAALPKVKVLGQDVPLVEATGNFADMQGDQHQGWTLLGAVAQKGEFTVFVKMTGPEAEVRAERERFLQFASSIR